MFLVEAQILLQEQENVFNQLPLETRKQFGFSFTQYIAEAGNDIKSWAGKMGLIKEAAADLPKEETPAPKEGGNE